MSCSSWTRCPHACLPTIIADSLDLLPDGKRKEALRKPISGKLIITLRSARDLVHRPLPRKSSKVFNETTVAIKIEGNTSAVSHPSRTDKWNEKFDIPVERANEVEITIYDTVSPGDTAPIGMLWLRVSDLMEALRRQKVGLEGQGAGWVTAATAATMGPRQGSAPDSVTLHSSGTLRAPPGSAGPDGRNAEGIDGWWSVEPYGAIQLRLDFGKSIDDIVWRHEANPQLRIPWQVLDGRTMVSVVKALSERERATCSR